MKIIKTAEITPGMELSEDVYLSGSILLLPKGLKLTKEHLRWLANLGVEYVSVHGAPTRPALGTVEPPFLKTYREAVVSAERILHRLVHHRELDEYELVATVKSLLQSVLSEPGVLKYLTWTREQSESIFSHLVGVSAYSIMLGKWLGYEDSKLMTIGLAGILHDMGKCLIPSEILDKPSSLTSDEYKIVQQHTTQGFHLALQGNVRRVEILSAILQHHERMDGSGYPSGINGSQIDELAKVIMVVDIFDAMTSNRSYRQSRTVFDAMEEILKESYFEKLEPQIAVTFINRMADHFIGLKVRLSDGASGKVIQIDQHTPHRPLVWANDRLVDLREHKNIKIEKVMVSDSEDK